MSNIIKRKVKKPTVIHRAKKVVNSQDKSLHRSMLSHSRIATGYKKKIAALLGNNRALAHALEMAHIELTNKDKIVVELQRRLTLQSPKRFKGKIQKVCEHLQVIVALLQDTLDDCDDFADANILSFDSKINISGKTDVVNNSCGSPPESQVTTDLTPFSTFQPQPRMTTAAEMSAILEQSVLLGDENLPPILFPEDDNQAMSNITRRTKSKSKSASSQLKDRESKRHSESPQRRKSSGTSNVDSVMNCEQRINDDAVEIPLSPLPLHLFNSDPSSKENSTGKVSPKSVNSESVYIRDSPSKFCSPGRKSPGNKMSIKRKSLSRRKNKKNRLIVKLPCTPRRSLERDNMKEISSEDPLTSKNNPDRRKTFTVNKSKKVNRRTFVISSKTGEVCNSTTSKNSPELHNEVELTSSPPLLHKEQDKDANYTTCNNNPTGNKKKQNSSDNMNEVRNLDSEANDDITCTVVQDMDLTSTLTENAVHEPDTRTKEVTGTLNDLLKSSSKNSSNFCSQFMHGYDPLEGTSKNKKSNISLSNRREKSLKSKSSTKIPKIIERYPTVTSQHITKDNGLTHAPNSRTECVNADRDVLPTLMPCSPTKFHTLSSKENIQSKNTNYETSNQNEFLSDGLSPKQSGRTLLNHIKEQSSNHAAIHKPNKERTTLQNKETMRDEEISSTDGVQPVVQLNDIWTSVKPQPSSTVCDNFVYISDSLDGKVLKVETPNKKLLKTEKESINQNTNEGEDEIIGIDMKENMSEKADSDDAASEGTLRKRRRTTPLSYKEPSLGKKLRQGDPFTSGLHNIRNLGKNEKKRKPRSCSMKKTYCEDGTSDSEKSEGC